MKICVIQPAYSTDYTRIDEYFEAELRLLHACTLLVRSQFIVLNAQPRIPLVYRLDAQMLPPCNLSELSQPPAKRHILLSRILHHM